MIGEVQNGKAWIMQEGDHLLYILSVSGSSYEMGYAQGQLLGKEISANANGMINYYEGMVNKFLKDYVPDFVADYLTAIAKKIFFGLLDLNYEVSKQFSPQRYFDEMQGIHDGSNGVADYELLRRLNYFPELIKAACSVVGVWGPATKDGKVYHLRALDWDRNSPAVKHPAVTIYNSNEEGSNVFANIGFLGLIGSLTGMSTKITTGEKVMIENDDSHYPVKPETTYFGKPWLFNLRDSLQFANTQDDVFNMLNGSKRTCQIHLGFASKETKDFRGYDYAANMLRAFDDKNFTDYSDAHP